MSEGLNLIDMMLKYEDRLVPLREISRQISGVAKHISENEGLNKKWKVKLSNSIELCKSHDCISRFHIEYQ